MQKAELFKLINANPVFALATVDNGSPRVRNMLLYKADETGIVFHTGATKDVYQQILRNPKVELCFYDPAQNLQMRVHGTLETVDDIALKDEISSHPTRAFLQGWKSSVPLQDFYDSFIVFKMKDAKAVVWTMATNLAPKEEIALF